MEFTSERVLPREDLWALYQEHLCRYNYAKKYVQNKKVLDAGCGEGYGTDLLAGFAKDITGVDISDEAVQHALNKYKRSNLKYLRMDCTKLEFPEETFDAVISFEVIEHVNDFRPFLSGVKKVMKKDGLAIISSPNALYSIRRDLPKHPFHIKEFEPEEFRQELLKYFSDVKLFGQWDKSFVERLRLAVRKYDVLNIRSKILPLLRRMKQLVYGKKQLLMVSAEEFSIEEDNCDDAPVLLAVCRK